MNKVAKGTIAAATGVVLLLGGAGSLAYWNAGADGWSQSTITAGALKIATAQAGVWELGQYDAANAEMVGLKQITDPASVQIVPGSRLVYTQTYNLTATGNDLYFKVSPVDGAVTASNTSTEPDKALASAINLSSKSGFGTVVSGVSIEAVDVVAGTYHVKTNSGATTMTITRTIDFPFGSGIDNSTQIGSVKLAAGAVTVTQIVKPA